MDPSDNEFLLRINAPTDILEQCLMHGAGHCKLNFLTISKYSLHALNKLYTQVLSVLEKDDETHASSTVEEGQDWELT
ncbi:hypothetical protein HDU77_000782, partial [Chytriomyces hyalinus]